MPGLFFGHCRVRNFFNYDDPEVIEGVSRLPEVLVDRYCVVPLGIIPVLVDSSVCFLGLQLPNVLLPVTSVAEGEVDGIGRFATSSLSDLESFLSCLVGEEVGVDHVSTAFCVDPGPAWGASALRFRFLPFHLVIFDSCLAQYISEVPIAFEANQWFLQELPALRCVDV